MSRPEGASTADSVAVQASRDPANATEWTCASDEPAVGSATTKATECGSNRSSVSTAHATDDQTCHGANWTYSSQNKLTCECRPLSIADTAGVVESHTLGELDKVRAPGSTLAMAVALARVLLFVGANICARGGYTVGCEDGVTIAGVAGGATMYTRDEVVGEATDAAGEGDGVPEGGGLLSAREHDTARGGLLPPYAKRVTVGDLSSNSLIRLRVATIEGHFSRYSEVTDLLGPGSVTMINDVAARLTVLISLLLTSLVLVPGHATIGPLFGHNRWSVSSTIVSCSMRIRDTAQEAWGTGRYVLTQRLRP